MVTLREAQRRAFEGEAGIQSSDGARPEEADRPRGVVVPAPVGEAAEDVLDQSRGQARQHGRHRPEPRDHPPREEVLTGDASPISESAQTVVQSNSREREALTPGMVMQDWKLMNLPRSMTLQPKDDARWMSVTLRSSFFRASSAAGKVRRTE